MADLSIPQNRKNRPLAPPRDCPTCGKTFQPPLSNVKQGYGIYCSKKCARTRLDTKTLITCLTCGKTVDSYAFQNRKYCSFECYQEARKQVEIICAQCGEPFKVYRRDLNERHRKYCSRECSANHRKNPNALCKRCGKPFPYKQNVYYCSAECRSKRNRVENNCKYCGKLILSIPSEIRVYCSPECREAHTKARSGFRCIKCGKHFVAPGKHNRKYCSKNCSNLDRIGPKHQAWKGGGDHERGPNWYQQRKAAYNRDGGICQNCGASHNPSGTRCSVHHITPFRQFGLKRYLEANALSNLITLCQSCHMKAEAGNIILQPRLL